MAKAAVARALAPCFTSFFSFLSSQTRRGKALHAFYRQSL